MCNGYMNNSESFGRAQALAPMLVLALSGLIWLFFNGISTIGVQLVKPAGYDQIWTSPSY